MKHTSPRLPAEGSWLHGWGSRVLLHRALVDGHQLDDT